MRFATSNFKRFVWLITIVILTFAYSEVSVSAPLVVPTNGKLIPINDSTLTGVVEPGVVEQACELVSRGNFDAADELIRKIQGDKSEQVSDTTFQLLNIINECKSINQQRQVARRTAYTEATAELDKFKTQTDTSDFNDINDVNNITEVLSVIAKTGEFADEKQKEQLLSDVYVKEILQKSIDKAAEFEVQGKWAEAYTNCYYWLVAIDPNNEGYSDYAKQLLNKASIAMSFEDSPCETVEERYQGVKEDMFIRAIDFLNSHYVSLIDYKQMATKAVEHCVLMAEVIGTSSRFAADLQNSGQDNPKIMNFIWEPQKLAAWSAALAALLDEIKSASGGITGLGKSGFIDVFYKVLKLNDSTVDLPRTIVVAQFVEAALSTLDPYTVIVWPRQAQDFEQMMTNEFTGIGVEISKQKGLLTISSLLLDTPAFNSSLDAGDVIEAVDGVVTKDISLSCAAKKIKGPAKTKVRLTVRRPSDDKSIEDNVFDVTITRDKIVVPTVRGWQRTHEGKWLYMIDPENKIGFVRLTSFSAATASGLEQVLRKLEDQGLRGLILDLRFNTGGMLDSAVAVTDKFIEDGLIVKRQSGLGRMPIYEQAHKKGTHPNYPLVILINYNSASASEIVAGALADKIHRRATLVGTRTHGKGSVQGWQIGFLGNGAQLKYTMAYYHLPSGQRVESRDAMEKQGRKDWGVGPNVEVELRNDELKKMIEVQRNNDVLVKNGRDNTQNDITKHTIEETLASDPQLAVGLLIVRSKLIQAETLAKAQLNN